ncbi:MAG: hypothetical protein R2747_20290 [Pyrinomonadaceae bacterium]
MDKTYQTDLRRTFLFQGLPEPLTPASAHLQIFDNYIENTRLRLRSIRVPEENKWTRVLQQRFPALNNDLSHWKMAEIHLDETEHLTLEKFEGREIRKNRYFFEWSGRQLELDVFLGRLWGLNLMTVHFETGKELIDFLPPDFVICEVTDDKFFTGEILVEKTFDEVRREFQKISQG